VKPKAYLSTSPRTWSVGDSSFARRLGPLEWPCHFKLDLEELELLRNLASERKKNVSGTVNGIGPWKEDREGNKVKVDRKEEKNGAFLEFDLKKMDLVIKYLD
jgi:hypothetical protein